MLAQTRQTKGRIWQRIRDDWQLYLFVLPALVYVIVFQILPLYGIQIAFRNYRVAFGIQGSPWVGLEHFKNFFRSYYCGRLIGNTFILNIFGLILGSILPVFLAVALNTLYRERVKHAIQTIIYVPHFISSVVLAGLIYILFSPQNGIVNKGIEFFGGQSVNFLLEARYFRPIYIGSSLWQNAGWNSILYIAALTSVDPQLYEAATIDGATRIQKILKIDLPSIIPVFTMMLILSCGGLLNSDTEKILLLQTSGNTTVSEVLGTYVYNVGINGGKFSYTAAIGLMTHVINFVMILCVNTVTKRMNGTQLF